MIEGLENLLDGSEQPGVAELRRRLGELLGGSAVAGRLIEQQQLPSRHPRVYRLRFTVNDEVRSLVVKRLEPAIAQRNYLVTRRWLPALGLDGHGPALLGAAAEPSGQYIWHVYEDLGDWALDARDPDPARMRAAVEVIAQVHTRFAGHPLLPECRLYGGDLGMHFFESNVRDAIRSLEWLRPPRVALSSEQRALRDRLLTRLNLLLEEQPARAQALTEFGGVETLLHGDLWTTNTFVIPAAGGYRARLIDWDHAGVGPFTYDLSTFLLRFPAQSRAWILGLYGELASPSGWRLPAGRDLNLVFETAEYARFANRIIWPAVALAEEQADWGFEELAEIEGWFEDLQPVFAEITEPCAASALQP